MELLSISNADYHSDTSRISKSGLDLIARSPLHYWHKYLNPDRKAEPERQAFVVGTATHSAILEPESFAVEYCAGIKVDKRTNAGKDAWANFEAVNTGKIILEPELYDSLHAMRAAVFANPAAAQMLAAGVAERTLHFTHAPTGVLCKVRPDWIAERPAYTLVVDVKTTEDASPAAFAKSIANYRYDVAQAFYSDGFTYAGHTKPVRFAFIAVEKSPPYAVACYYLPDEDVAIGREKYTENLQAFAACKAAGVWTSYGDATKVNRISLPTWALNK